MNRAIISAFVGGIALVLSGAASAQTVISTAAAASSFPALMAEAQTKVPSNAERGTINTSLSTAQWHWEAGNQVQAISYLNFARSKLGLSTLTTDTAIQQANRTADATP